LISNKREATRTVANAQGTKPEDRLYRAIAQDGHSTSALCHKGAQNCTFKADVAFAVHSLYDVSHECVARIFQQHGLSEMYVYLYIPCTFHHKDLSALDKPYFNLHPHGSDTIFTLKDASTPYIHNTANWKSWLQVTCIDAKNFSITKEVFQRFGPLYIFRLVRIAPFPGRYTMSCPLGSITADIVLVPSLLDAKRHKFAVPQDDLRHHIVPLHVARTAMSYSARQADESYKFVELATVLGGMTRALKIGNVVYAKAWEVDPADFTDAAMSLFLIGALKRMDRTKTISAAFTHIKKYIDGSTFDDLVYSVRSYFIRTFELFEKEPNHNPTNLWHYDIRSLSDQPYSKHIRVNAHVERFADDDVSIASDYDSPNYDRFGAPLNATKAEWYQGLDSPSGSIHSAESVASLAQPEDFDEEPNIEAPIQVNREITAPLPMIPFNGRQIPSSFHDTGHCLVRSFWLAYWPDCARIKQRELLRTVHYLGHKFVSSGYKCEDQHGLEVIKYTNANVDDYVYDGVWNTNFVDALPHILAHHYNVTINIFTTNDDNATYVLNRDTGRVLALNYDGSHYTVRHRGGKGMPKFAALMKHYDFTGRAVLETSAAPGILASILAPVCEYTFGHYTKGIAIHKDHVVKGQHITISGKKCSYFAYDSAHNIAKHKYEYQTVICDAAAECYSETLINIAAPASEALVAYGGDFIIKAFINMRVVSELAAKYENMEIWRDPDATGVERYYIMRNKSNVVLHDPAQLFNNNVEPETVHCVRYEPAALTNFMKSFYTGKFLQMAEVVPPPQKRHIFNIYARTGYASASKTTSTVELYPDALYIAPTKKLAREHNERFHVKSMTQHVALEHVHSADHIIIDEISQLPVEYLMLIHTINPQARITVMGDIYQIPYVDYTNACKFTHISAVGVENNLNVVYKIPQDIATILRAKFHYPIISESPVQNSMCVSRTLEAVKHLPIIVFNDSTKNRLKNLKYNVHTITTFEGSREDAVVFYIDDKAITSQLINRTEWVYTALTRHKQQLVFVGNTEYITKFFAIKGTQLPAYEEFSGVSIVNDCIATKVYEMESPVGTELTAVRERVQQEEPALPVVENILTKAFTPALPDSTAYIHPTIPEVEEGQLRVDPIDVQTVPPVVRGLRLIDNVPIVTQTSNDPFRTIDTLVKRYAKKNVRLPKARNDVMLSQLLRGLSKAIFGNEHSVHKIAPSLYVPPNTLRKHLCEYIESLQQKMNANSSIADEIGRPMDWFDEVLTFVMKKQGKFSPKDGYDATDKAGQGVAAMSKRINLLLAAYARALNEQLNKILRANGSKCHLASFGSDQEIADLLMALLARSTDPDLRFVDNDYSEWDVRFLQAFQDLTSYLIEAMGCPPFLVAYFAAFRKHWKMIYKRGKTANAILTGYQKQFSGNPFTLVENCIGNMALTNFLYDFVKLLFAIYKGDDSSHRCKSAKLTDEGAAFLAVSKHKLKLSTSSVGEFASFILTDKYAGPDLYRRCAKFAGQMYRDETHFNDAKINTISAANIIKSSTQLAEICCATAMHYGLDRITPSEVETLYHFAHTTAPKISHKHLLERNLHVLQC
jgi:hypothetical protein